VTALDAFLSLSSHSPLKLLFLCSYIMLGPLTLCTHGTHFSRQWTKIKPFFFSLCPLLSKVFPHAFNFYVCKSTSLLIIPTLGQIKTLFVFGLCRDLHSSDYMKHRIKYLGLSHGNSSVNRVLWRVQSPTLPGKCTLWFSFEVKDILDSGAFVCDSDSVKLNVHL